jgi:hypothetical protein
MDVRQRRTRPTGQPELIISYGRLEQTSAYANSPNPTALSPDPTAPAAAGSLRRLHLKT